MSADDRKRRRTAIEADDPAEKAREGGVVGFPERLVTLREKAGETQEDLARALDVNTGAISRYERGINTPRGEHLVLIARHYGVSTDHLLLGETTGDQAESEAFRRFLGTEYGRIAQRNGWVDILRKMPFPKPPTVQTYKNFVHALLSSEDDVNGS